MQTFVARTSEDLLDERRTRRERVYKLDGCDRGKGEGVSGWGGGEWSVRFHFHHLLILVDTKILLYILGLCKHFWLEFIVFVFIFVFHFTWIL